MATLKEEKNKRVKKTDQEKNEMLELFRQMYLIRQFELACGENYTKGNIRGFLHLYIGQEATAVGSISCLNDEDYIIYSDNDEFYSCIITCYSCTCPYTNTYCIF